MDYPGGLQLIYPTGPIRLSPSNLISIKNESSNSDEVSDTWGWWTRDSDTDLYKGLEEGLECIAHVIYENNGIDGVIGFSQGAAAAALVASLLEPERPHAFEKMLDKEKRALPFPEAWRNLASLCPDGLKFAVAYSGFLPSHSAYQAFFEPSIQTPFLHFIGMLDSVVSEERTLALVDKCAVEKRKVVFHQGAHFVPTSKQMTEVLIKFIQDCLKVQMSSSVSSTTS